jgi:hypothetical protein
MQYDFAVGANGAQRIEVSGRFFKYISGTGKIRVVTNKGGCIDLVPGQGVGADNFTSLSVKDRTGLANAGTILAGDFDFKDDNVYGTVKVLDDAFVQVRNKDSTRSLAGAAFVGGGWCNGTATAGYQQLVGLHNPAASGKNVAVSSLIWSSNLPAGVKLYLGSTAMAIGAAHARNKLATGAASAAIITTNEVSVAAVVTPLGAPLMELYIDANSSYDARGGNRNVFDEPIVIPPGYALLMINSNPAQIGNSILGYYEFTEAPV